MANCPYCNTNRCGLDVARANVENYGSNTFHLPCRKCGKMIKVGIVRETKVIFINESDRPRKESDF